MNKNTHILLALLLGCLLFVTIPAQASAQEITLTKYGPYVDQIVFSLYANPDAMAMALRKGEIDLMGIAAKTPYEATLLSAMPDVDVAWSPPTMLMLLFGINHRGTTEFLTVKLQVKH